MTRPSRRPTPEEDRTLLDVDDPPTHSFRPKNQYQHLFTPPTELLGNSPRLLLLQSRQAAEVPESERLKPVRVRTRR